MSDICPHLNCLVYHYGKPCTCDMKRYCAECKKEATTSSPEPRQEQRDIEEESLRRDMEEHPERYDSHKGIEPRL